MASSSSSSRVENSLLSSVDRVVLDGDGRDVIHEKYTYLATILLAQKVIDGTISRTMSALDERVSKCSDSVAKGRKRRRPDGAGSEEGGGDFEDVRRTEEALEKVREETDGLKALLLGEVKDLWLENMKRSNRLPVKKVQTFIDLTENDDNNSIVSVTNSASKRPRDLIDLISKRWFAQPFSNHSIPPPAKTTNDNWTSSYGKAPKFIPKVNMFATINKSAAAKGAMKRAIEIGYEVTPSSELTFSLANGIVGEKGGDKKTKKKNEKKSESSDEVSSCKDSDNSDPGWCLSTQFDGFPRPGHRMAVHRSVLQHNVDQSPAAVPSVADGGAGGWVECRFVRKVKLAGSEALKHQAKWRRYSMSAANPGARLLSCEPSGVRLRLSGSGDMVDISYPSSFCRVLFSQQRGVALAASGACCGEGESVLRDVCGDGMLKLLAADDGDADDDVVELMTMSLYEDPDDATVATALKEIIVGPRLPAHSNVEDGRIIHASGDVAGTDDDGDAIVNADALGQASEDLVVRRDTDADLVEIDDYFRRGMRNARVRLVFESDDAVAESSGMKGEEWGAVDPGAVLLADVDDPWHATEPPDVTIVASTDRIVRASDMWRVDLTSVYIKLPQHDFVASKCVVKAMVDM